MNTILACTSYWHTAEQYEEQLTGRADPSRIVGDTKNIRHHLRPEYDGKLGLKAWCDRYFPLLNPIEAIIACGTWSDPWVNTLPVGVANSGVEPTLPHSMHWQYMGCALTALCARAVTRKDWDVLVLAESDMLPGKIDWPAWIGNFMSRPEIVAGPAWHGVHCDFILWKREACVRFLHQRLRPNLTLDKWCMYLDYELDALFEGKAWNPWPDLPTIRADHWHPGSPKYGRAEVMQWPFVRQPDPEIVDQYLARNVGNPIPPRP